jgi:hypothetical protein
VADNNKKMKQITKQYCVIAVLILSLTIPAGYSMDEAESKEYQLKSAFLFNFLKFVDWPKNSDSNEITIGIISKEPLDNLFEPLKNKKVRNKNVIIKQFPGFEELQKLGKQNQAEMDKQLESIRKCQLLFICASETASLKNILEQVKDKNVLTVGETENFLKAGGIINFVVEEKKVRFEINMEASDKAKLKISSQLLQLAKNVIKSEEHP